MCCTPVFMFPSLDMSGFTPPKVQTESSEMSMRHLTLMLPLATALQLGGRGWTAPRVRAVASAPAAEAELLALLEASGRADRGKALSANLNPNPNPTRGTLTLTLPAAP